MSLEHVRALLADGQFEAALDACQALPPDAPSLCFRSAAQLGLGKTDAALESARSALEQAPNDPICHFALGSACLSQDDGRAAVQHFHSALSLKPGWPEASIGLAAAYVHLNAPDSALDILLTLPEPIPRGLAFQAHTLIARASSLLNDWTQVLEATAAGLPYAPKDLALREMRALAFLASNQLQNARDLATEILEDAPDTVKVVSCLANAALSQGNASEAATLLGAFLARQGDDANLTTLYAYVLNYVPKVDAETIARAHHVAASQHVAPDRPLAIQTARADRRLRIGFLSGDFRNHSVINFLLPLIESLDRTRNEVFLYYTQSESDDFTIRCMVLADGWRNVDEMPDEAAARLIAADRLDVLVDCAGLTLGNRLGILARKPAPIQVSWLGYPNSTGLPTIDYRLTDRIADPPDTTPSQRTGEALRYLPRGFLCYAGPADVPVASAPSQSETSQSEKGITLGSYNALAKLSDATVALWADVMRDLPDVRLVLKAYAFGDEPTAQRTKARFEVAGIDPARILCRPFRTDPDGALLAYADIDIALDPIPYNGTTTTCEALWMGVPVVTLRGTTHAGRVGASLLTQLGATAWIAEDPAAYRKIIAGLAANPERLGKLRAQLRGQMLKGPLGDPAGFARAFEASLRTMTSRP